MIAVGTSGSGVPCEQSCIIKENMGCGSPQVTESSGWWGFLASGILVAKGEAGLLVTNVLVVVPCQSSANKGEMKTQNRQMYSL